MDLCSSICVLQESTVQSQEKGKKGRKGQGLGEERETERKRQKVYLVKQYSIIPLYTHVQPVSFQRREPVSTCPIT